MENVNTDMAKQAALAASELQRQRIGQAPPSVRAEAYSFRSNTPIVILCALGVIAATYFARDILIPIVLAIFMTVLLRPLMRRMRRYRLPDLFSAFVLVATVAVIFGVGALQLAGQAQQWLTQAPQSIHKVSGMIPTGSGLFVDLVRMRDAVDKLTNLDNSPKPVPVEIKSQDSTITAIGFSGHLLGTTIIVFVLSFFLLAFSETVLKQAVESRDVFQEKRDIVVLVQKVEPSGFFMGTGLIRRSGSRSRF